MISQVSHSPDQAFLEKERVKHLVWFAQYPSTYFPKFKHLSIKLYLSCSAVLNMYSNIADLNDMNDLKRKKETTRKWGERELYGTVCNLSIRVPGHSRNPSL